jgi:hypothetical protein
VFVRAFLDRTCWHIKWTAIASHRVHGDTCGRSVRRKKLAPSEPRVRGYGTRSLGKGFQGSKTLAATRTTVPIMSARQSTISKESILKETAIAWRLAAALQFAPLSERLAPIPELGKHARLGETSLMAKRMTNSTRWTADEDDRLKTMAVAGHTAGEIAAALHRSVSAVYARSLRFGFSLRQTKQRPIRSRS